MQETAKNYEMRVKRGDFENYLNGEGIDIGGGDDCLKLPSNVNGMVRLWDIMDGDAQYMHKLKDESFDFVYSSHCLEHMRDIRVALMNWIRICKRGGYFTSACLMRFITKKGYGHRRIMQIINGLLQ